MSSISYKRYALRHKHRRKEAEFRESSLNFTVQGNKLVGRSKDNTFRGFAYISASIDDARRAILTDYNYKMRDIGC